MTDAFALEATAVTKRFGASLALADAHLAVRHGEVHALVGPNGAGKTTLLRIFLGLIRQDAGTVSLLGTSRDSSGGRLPDSVAGFVDTPAFYPYLSARANLTLLAGLDLRGGADRPTVARALEEAGLGPVADAQVGTYSAGMRQRLGIAAALLRRPALLLLDEPTSALDPAGARDVRGQLARLAADGAAVLFASHDLAQVEAMCSVVTIIDRGRVGFSGPIADLRARVPRAIHTLRTSDDRAALDLASGRHGLTATAMTGALELEADEASLDAYVILLGKRGIAIRSLERRAPSLESLFLQLTATVEPAPAPGSTNGTGVGVTS
jgi:ABC-2 type transport system ATP-binding protein